MAKNECFRYSLGKLTTTCPACGRKTFKPYFDTVSGEILDESVGRCNRENNCGYHLRPRDFFRLNPEAGNNRSGAPLFVKSAQQKPSFIAEDLVSLSLARIDQDVLFNFLASLYGSDATKFVFELYRVGSTKPIVGATIFWLTDSAGRTRSGKFMNYGANGHRLKSSNGRSLIYWAHSKLNYKSFVFVNCFFGEHLAAKFSDATIYVFESEKTALIFMIDAVSRFGPDVLNSTIAVATGGASNLSFSKFDLNNEFSKFNVLVSRNVVLIPDADMVKKWMQFQKNLIPITNAIKLLDLTRKPICLENSEDYGDYLIRKATNNTKKQ